MSHMISSGRCTEEETLLATSGITTESRDAAWRRRNAPNFFVLVVARRRNEERVGDRVLSFLCSCSCGLSPSWGIATLSPIALPSCFSDGAPARSLAPASMPKFGIQCQRFRRFRMIERLTFATTDSGFPLTLVIVGWPLIVLSTVLPLLLALLFTEELGARLLLDQLDFAGGGAPVLLCV
jgi:hypothetical protein